MRRTYASLRAALRDDPAYIAEQLGHEDPGFTFRVYARAVKRRERLESAHLVAFDRALQWAEMGRIDAGVFPSPGTVEVGRIEETALQSRNLD